MFFSPSQSDALASRMRWIPVQGDSMWPALRPGDEAGFDGAAGPLREGQVVVARLPSAIVVHRVVGVAGERVRLKGDNCRTEDPPVSPEAIYGVVSRVRRGGKLLTGAGWDPGPRRFGPLRRALRQRLIRALRVLGRAR